MASKKYREITEFRALLMRLVEDETKLHPQIVDSMYDQLFNDSFIQSYSDYEINQVYTYLESIKTGYKIVDLKELQNYFKRMDTMTDSMIKYLDNPNLEDPVQQIERKAQSQVENAAPDPESISILEAVYHATSKSKTADTAKKLCDEQLRQNKGFDKLQGFRVNSEVAGKMISRRKVKN